MYGNSPAVACSVNRCLHKARLSKLTSVCRGSKSNETGSDSSKGLGGTKKKGVAWPFNAAKQGLSSLKNAVTHPGRSSSKQVEALCILSVAFHSALSVSLCVCLRVSVFTARM